MIVGATGKRTEDLGKKEQAREMEGSFMSSAHHSVLGSQRLRTNWKLDGQEKRTSFLQNSQRPTDDPGIWEEEQRKVCQLSLAERLIPLDESPSSD